jgi:hypothetical protein
MGGVSSETVEQLRNIGIINSTILSNLVGSFYEIYVTMYEIMNVMQFAFYLFCVDLINALCAAKPAA